MKKFLSLLISIMIVVSSVGVIGFASDSEHWAYDSIKDMLDEGIISGDQNGNLNLDNSVTRAEFAKVINKYFGFTIKSDEGFFDVSENSWYYNDLMIAKGHGYMLGDQNKNANPDAKITRAEVAVIIARILGLEDDLDTSFNDSSDIPQWAKGKIGALVKKGVIKGYDDGSFKAENPMTRAEAFVVISRNERAVLPSDEKAESSDMGNQSSMSHFTGSGQGAYERPSGSGGSGSSGGGGGSGIADTKSTTIDSKFFDKDTGELEFVATNSESYKIKFVVNGAPYEETLVLTKEDGTYKYANFLSLIEPLVKKVGFNGFNAEVYVKAIGSPDYKDSDYLKFGEVYCELDIPDVVTNIALKYEHINKKYNIVWDKSDEVVVDEFKIYIDEKEVGTTDGETESIDVTSSVTENTAYTVRVDAIIDSFTVPSENIKIDTTLTFYMKNGISGAGTEAAPYIIDEASKFTAVFGCDNNDDETYGSGIYYKITENLTITGDHKANKMLFQGILYADENKTIKFSSIPNNQLYLNELKSDSDLEITDSNKIAYAALFPAAKGAVIKNLTLEGAMTNSNANLVGSFVSVAHSTVIENCVNNIDMPCSSSGKNGAVGGFIGAARTGTVVNGCINNGDVTGTNAVGGIIGDSCVTVTNCANFGDITSTDRAGGIIGDAYNAIVSYSYNFGKISASNAGGIFALCNIDEGTTATGCFNAGEILGTTYSGAIGIASQTGANRCVIVADCYNINSNVKMGEGGTVTVANSYTINSGDINQGLTNLSLIELKDVKLSSYYTLYSENLSNENYNKSYIFPQISGNLVPLDFEYKNADLLTANLSISYNDGESKYYLSWTAPLGGIPSVYKVYVGDTFIGETSESSIDVNSYVEANQSYDFKVIAVFDGIEFETITNISVPAVGLPAGVGVPKNVALKYEYVNKKFNIVWDKSDEVVATRFEIYIDGTKVAETTDGETEIFDVTSFVTADSTYTVRVDAIVGSFTASSDNTAIDTTLTFYMKNGIQGSGTEADPYIIDEASKFTAIFSSANSNAETYGSGIYYKITENLTITGDHKANKMLFQGVLYADENKTIKFSSIPNNQFYLNELKSDPDMEINNNNRIAYATLFPAAKGAVIKNLTLEGTMANSNANIVGAFVAVAHSTVIKNCVNNIDMPCSSSGKNGAVGGFIGAARTGTVVEGCTNNGDVTGTNAVGGIVGDSCATVTDCKNNGDITGTVNVGGIVGNTAEGGSVSSDCENSGNVVKK